MSTTIRIDGATVTSNVPVDRSQLVASTTDEPPANCSEEPLSSHFTTPGPLVPRVCSVGVGVCRRHQVHVDTPLPSFAVRSSLAFFIAAVRMVSRVSRLGVFGLSHHALAG